MWLQGSKAGVEVLPRLCRVWSSLIPRPIVHPWQANCEAVAAVVDAGGTEGLVPYHMVMDSMAAGV